MLSVLENDTITIRNTGSRNNKAKIPSTMLKTRFQFQFILFNCFFFFMAVSSLIQNMALSGSTLETIRFANSTNTRPTTDWNRPAAVVIPMFT